MSAVPWMKGAFTVLLAVALIVYLAATWSAYRQRQDKSFWGGSDVLTGFWLLSPYGEGGVPESAHKAVLIARVSLLVFYLAIGVAWVL